MSDLDSIMAKAPERFARRLAGKLTVTESGCVEFSGFHNEKGYSILWNPDGTRFLHRMVYEWSHGPAEKNMAIDHLCRNRGCVNPKHLELVTVRENNKRGYGASAVNAAKTHCLNGHPFSGENLVYGKKGQRYCRVCRKLDNERHEKRLYKMRNHLARIRDAAGPVRSLADLIEDEFNRSVPELRGLLEAIDEVNP